MKKVELIEISKSYNKQNEVISNINVTIEPGEFFVLVGPSGCGKSTMLRMIAGLEEITGGTLKIGDKLQITYHQANVICRWYSKTMPFFRILQSNKILHSVFM